ncbi:nuclear transport factor 2 family protein [Streptomyces hebeiensis]|uniref:Nuclear transport factor 2 family protein n=1 Tax=Streptomyces hebeiensis TaxID=229486 RepID=A0ABN1V445_9ACTN|nr:nuclear transport factor 2 family protein [Streptomyces sp. NRRL F-5135]
MTDSDQATGNTGVSTDLYTRVQQFYARQMQALDGGRFEDYAATFTKDGTFQHSPGAEPAVGRDGIVAELIEFHKRFDGDPVQRRHWFNHVVLEPLDDGSLRSTVYALVVTTRPGGKPLIAPSCVVNDVLEVEGGAVLTRSRQIDHDQLV